MTFDNNERCKPSRYHVPRAWLKPTENSLVLFEELGGDPTRISLVKRSMTTVCADMFEYHPNIKDWHIESYGKTQELHRPNVHLHCGPGLTISAIKFASFGTPLGTCGTFQQGTCHSPASYDVVQKVPLIALDPLIGLHPMLHQKGSFRTHNCLNRLIRLLTLYDQELSLI